MMTGSVIICAVRHIISMIYSTFYNMQVYIWASTQENRATRFANNKGADQPAHPRQLISAFVISFLESDISKLCTGDISIYYIPINDTSFKLSVFWLSDTKSRITEQGFL